MNILLKMMLVLVFALPTTAFAYLDPGTGSMLLQVILGGIAAVAVALKLFWYRILAMFGIKKKSEDAVVDPATSESDDTDSDDVKSGGGGWD